MNEKREEGFGRNMQLLIANVALLFLPTLLMKKEPGPLFLLFY